MKLPAELWPLVWTRAGGTSWPPASDADADRLFAAANDQGLLPLLMAADDLPPAVEAAKVRHRAWDAIYRYRYALARDALPQLAVIIGADSFTCYKGSDFAHRLYPGPVLRPMSDIDVLVPRARFSELLTQLAALGHDRKRGAHGAPFSPDHFEASIMFGELHFELHQTFAQPIRNRVDYDGLFLRREAFDAGGLTLWRFARADAILAQAFELAKDEFRSNLIRHVDFHLLIHGHDDLLSLCVARARDWQVERALFGALALHCRFFPSMISATIGDAMEALLTPGIRRGLCAGVLAAPGAAQDRGQQIRHKLQLIDRPWRRAALPAVAAWQEIKGRWYERRARRSGITIPPRGRPA